MGAVTVLPAQAAAAQDAGLVRFAHECVGVVITT